MKLIGVYHFLWGCTIIKLILYMIAMCIQSFEWDIFLTMTIYILTLCKYFSPGYIPFFAGDEEDSPELLKEDLTPPAKAESSLGGVSERVDAVGWDWFSF